MKLLDFFSLFPSPSSGPQGTRPRSKTPDSQGEARHVKLHSPSLQLSKKLVSTTPPHHLGADIQALNKRWEVLEYLASRLPAKDAEGPGQISKKELEEARALALGTSLLIATQPEEAANKISIYQEAIERLISKAATLQRAGDPKLTKDYGAKVSALQAFQRLLRAQKDHADGLVKVNPFNKDLNAQGRSLLWQAAAKLVPTGPGQTLFHGRANFLSSPDAKSDDHKRSASESDPTAQSSLHEPAQVARPGRKSKTVKIARGCTIRLANVAFVDLRGKLRGNHDLLRGQVENAVKKHQVNERALAQASVAAVLKDGNDKSLAGKKIKDRFRITLNQVFKSRKNPVIERVLPVPVRTVDGKASTTTLIKVTCRQEPARVLTASLARQYASDRIEGVNCHDDMQHQHALNLYRSTLQDEEERPLLSMIRHGVHSATALTPAGIKALTDEELGKIALDLCDACGDSGLQRIRGKAIKVVHTAGSDAKYEVSAATESAAYSSEGLQQAGAYVRRTTRYHGIPHSLWNSLGPSLLDRLRMAANQRRALESAQAAITCLPPQELQRIAGSQTVPVVRLASVSMLTPDAVRGALKGPTKDEGLMWQDQQAAWQTLAASDGFEMDIPVESPSGDTKHGAGIAESQAQTKRVKVKLDIAAFNIPVNKWGAHPVTGDWSLMVGNSHEANDAAIEKLIGPLPVNRAAIRSWSPGGWVGEALRRPGLAQDLLRALARQVAEICIEPDAGTKRQADPYRLVKRLLVLVHETGLAAPMVNCRSGKDRTSEAETQARQFALEASVRGAADLPSIDLAPGVSDDIQRLQLWNLQQGGGSREIQHWNTGFAGTKLKDPALLAQYGADQDKGLRHQYLGMSAHVSA